jgi:hypothetical protein
VEIPDVDFARIRPYGQPASRTNAFEELASVLLESGVVEWPRDTVFHRFGNPDGGREGKGVLPSGDVWAWQVKYLFEFDASAASQVSESVKRTLEREPNLKKYFVVLPIDLPAGDTATRTSAHTRWSTKVAEWKQAAAAQGLEVDFVFIGAHQLMNALTDPRHAGRVRYWFGAEVLGPEWLARRLEEAVAKVGRRYSPKLHVEVDTVQAVEAAARSNSYGERWQQILADLRTARNMPLHPPQKLGSEFAHDIAQCEQALDAADAALQEMVQAVRSFGELPSINVPLRLAMEAAAGVGQVLHDLREGQDDLYVGEAGMLGQSLFNISNALYQAHTMVISSLLNAAQDRMLLMTGRAGVGKTHLLCDVATARIAGGQPTLLLLGQDFDDRPLSSQIGDLTQLGGYLDDVLAVLNAAGEAAGCMGLLMIDALNESERPERWRAESGALATATRRYSHVALVLTCRTEFVEAVVNDWSGASLEHVGFGEATEAAVRRFTQEYDLEPPTFPVLNPEFGNPLYLRLTCESLKTLGEERFTFGAAGLSTVCESFIEAVNQRLAEPDRCDYDSRVNLVGRVVNDLAALDGHALDRTKVDQITSTALPNRPWSRSLLRGMIAEGVLVEVGDGRIAFGYQRLGDLARAKAHVAEKSLAELGDWIRGLGSQAWRERGVLAALAVIVPESEGVDLIEIAIDDAGRLSSTLVDDFLESLLLRSRDSVSLRTVDFVQRLLASESFSDKVWDRLIRIACIPEHPLNATWLHSHLAGYELPARDASWTAWLAGAGDEYPDSPTRLLIDWAWPVDLSQRPPRIPQEVAELAVLVLAWLLTSTDRAIRDQATKAIVSIAERAPGPFACALAHFAEVNDPYVIERLAAAACGAVFRINEAAAVHQIADAFRPFVADGWPPHLLTRDYLRRVFKRAAELGWSGPQENPPYGAQWPHCERTVDQIETLVNTDGSRLGTIWHSIAHWGDFGRYILEPALRDIDTTDSAALKELAQAAVFDRVLELGWTTEQLAETDKRLAQMRNRGVERIGKKYQWIALYETLGRISDHYALRDRWGDETTRRYEYAEQLVWRDIDPTVLVRKPTPPKAPPWYASARVEFPTAPTDSYPADLIGVPDPLDLITVHDPTGMSWLVLVTLPDWEQPLAPEVAALNGPRRTVWAQVYSYIVPISGVDGLRLWAQGRDWYGHSMPQVAEVSSALLGALPDDPHWAPAIGEIDDWEPETDESGPAGLQHTAAFYGGTGTSRDASADRETHGCVPSRRLFEALGLTSGIDFVWFDQSGPAVQDPAASGGGPVTLAMRHDLAPPLAEAGFTLLWTVLIQSELHHGEIAQPDGDYRWVTASGSYILMNGEIERLHTIAKRCKPGPDTEYKIDWETKPVR